MNGRKAKKLRKLVYGDQSIKAERTYASASNGVTIVNTGLRAHYQYRKECAKRGTDYYGLLFGICG